jgi:hypothetical protein
MRTEEKERRIRSDFEEWYPIQFPTQVYPEIFTELKEDGTYENGIVQAAFEDFVSIAEFYRARAAKAGF